MMHAVRNNFNARHFHAKFPRQGEILNVSFLGIDIMPTRSIADWMKSFGGVYRKEILPRRIKGCDDPGVMSYPPFGGTSRGLRVFSYKTTRALSRGRSLVVNKKVDLQQAKRRLTVEKGEVGVTRPAPPETIVVPAESNKRAVVRKK